MNRTVALVALLSVAACGAPQTTSSAGTAGTAGSEGATAGGASSASSAGGLDGALANAAAAAEQTGKDILIDLGDAATVIKLIKADPAAGLQALTAAMAHLPSGAGLQAALAQALPAVQAALAGQKDAATGAATSAFDPTKDCLIVVYHGATTSSCAAD